MRTMCLTLSALELVKAVCCDDTADSHGYGGNNVENELDGSGVDLFHEGVLLVENVVR